MKGAPLSIVRTKFRRESGAVVIIFGLTVFVLFGFVGLAIDLGRFFVIKAELQNAMDACALAAASQLKPGQKDSNALIRAIAYGKVFSTGGVPTAGVWTAADGAKIKNKANFQSQVVNENTIQISFSSTLSPDSGYSSDTNLYNTAKYAKCQYPLAGLPIYFMRVLNLVGLGPFTTQTVSAMAVATLGPSICNLIPVGICPYPGESAPRRGQWFPLKRDPDSIAGWFNWVDFIDQGGGRKEVTAKLIQEGTCDSPPASLAEITTQQGKERKAQEGWNTRFGIYENENTGNPPVNRNTAHPDRTGYSYFNLGGALNNWPRPDTDPVSANMPLAHEGSNISNSSTVNYQAAVDDYLPYQGTDIFQGKDPTILTCMNSSDASTCELKAAGSQRRIVVVPVMNCSTKIVTELACVLMLNPFGRVTGQGGGEVHGKLEYLGPADASPCGAAISGPNMSVLVK